MGKNQQGFTLIEIITVLIILGILAVLALPRYFAMQDEARLSAVQGALAAGQGNINLAYAKYLASGGKNATLLGNQVSGMGGTPQVIPTELGDFTAAYALDGATNCKVTISGTSTTPWVSALPAGSNEKSVACPWSS